MENLKIEKIKQKIYKIDNGYLLNVELDYKQLKEWKKKYYYYERDGIIIFNFDYNKIKPFVMSILSKKGYLEDIEKKTLLLIAGFLLVFVLIFYLFQKNVNDKNKEILSKLSKIEANFNSDNIITGNEYRVINPILGTGSKR